MPKRKKQSAITVKCKNRPCKQNVGNNQPVQPSTSGSTNQDGLRKTAKPQPKRKKYTATQVRDLILASDSEDILDNDYNDNDLETDDSDVDASDIVISSSRIRPTAGSQSYWSTDTSSFISTDAQFKPTEQLGPKNIPNTISVDSKPLDYLELFWDESIWDLIVFETNRQAGYVKAKQPNNYCAKSFEAVTVPELKAFFGCRLAMELLIYKERYELYWKKKDSWITATPGFSKVFTRDRFLAIWTMLHCVNEEDPSLNKSDKIYKSRPIFDIIMAKFQQHYVPDAELSLDEGMIPTKNALSIKQYIKDKPIKWGIKTFILCESSTGYIMNAEVYTGKAENDPEIPIELGVTGSLVARLCKPFSMRNHCIFTDRFYTSVTLAEYLLQQQGTRVCGTAMTNRKKFPKELVKKKMERGTHSLLYNGTTAAVVWCDKKPIYFLSTKYVTDSDVAVLRYDAKEHKRMPVACPALVKAYNSFMGGTDKNDQMTKLQRCRRHYKWPRRLTMKFMVWCAYNGYIIQNYYKPHIAAGKRTHTFKMFIDELCHDLVGSYRRTVVPMSRRMTGDDETRLQNEANVPLHLVERPHGASSNNRCAVCS
jgi:hypothetical protein